MPNTTITATLSYWEDSDLATVCGIANAGGGTIFVQSMDRKGFRERNRFRKLFETIPTICMHELGLSCPTEPVMEGGELCLEITVPRAEKPVSYLGNYYLHSNGSDQLISREELEHLYEQNEDAAWENRLQAFVREEDFDPDMVYALSQQISNMLGEDSSPKSVSRLLHDHGIKNKQTGSFTNIGVLLLHKAPHRYIPGAEVRIEMFNTDGTNSVMSESIIGPLTKQLSRTLESLYDQYLPSTTSIEHDDDTQSEDSTQSKGAVHSSESRTNEDTTLLPFDAVKEALLNALVHKDYESGMPVRVSIFPDKLYIDNVGRPPETWTLTDFLGRHNSRPHNPMLARALQVHKLFNGWGGGVSAMISICTKAGLPEPVFTLRADEMDVCFRFGVQPDILPDAVNQTERPTATSQTVTPATNAQPYDPASAHKTIAAPKSIRPSMPSAKEGKQTFKERSVAAANRLDMTSTDEYVLKVIETNGRVTAIRIAAVLGVSESTVRRSFKRLREYGFIERIGSDKAGYWRLID